eukprot:403346007
MSKRSHSSTSGLRSGLKQVKTIYQNQKDLPKVNEHSTVMEVTGKRCTKAKEAQRLKGFYQHFENEERSETGTISKLRIGRSKSQASSLLNEIKSAQTLLKQELMQGLDQVMSLETLLQQIAVENPIVHFLALILDRLQTNFLDYQEMLISKIQQVKENIQSLLLKKREQLEKVNAKVTILDFHDRNNLKLEENALYTTGFFVKRIESDLNECKKMNEMKKLNEVKDDIVKFVKKQMQGSSAQQVQQQIEVELQLMRRKFALQGNEWMYMSNFGDPRFPHPIRQIYSQAPIINRVFQDDITDLRSPEAVLWLTADSYLFRNYLDIKGYSMRYYPRQLQKVPTKVMIYIDQ